MTPKEKAEELFNKFCKSMPLTYINNEIVLGISEEAAAKRCALIAVEEIIKQNVSTTNDWGASWTYWMQVKQEIENTIYMNYQLSLQVLLNG